MSDSTFTFRVDEELKSAFSRVADDQDRTAAQLLRALMRGEIQRFGNDEQHDAWFRGEVERAVADADDADVTRTRHDEVESDWQRQRAELERRAVGRTA